MKILLIISCLNISVLAFSQKKKIEFGQVSAEEIEMTNYEKDINAKAVVLYDKGESSFFRSFEGYSIRHTRHRRIKIFDQNATQHTEISIPYFFDRFITNKMITSIEAITINVENGNTTHKK